MELEDILRAQPIIESLYSSILQTWTAGIPWLFKLYHCNARNKLPMIQDYSCGHLYII